MKMLSVVLLLLLCSGCNKTSNNIGNEQDINIYPIKYNQVKILVNVNNMSNKLKNAHYGLLNNGYDKYTEHEYSSNNSKYRYLIYHSMQEGNSEAERGVHIAILQVKYDDQSWNLVSLNRDIGGLWGEPPTSHLIKVGQDKYAIAFYHGFSKMGDSQETISLYCVLDNKAINIYTEEVSYNHDNKGYDSKLKILDSVLAQRE